MKIGIFGGSFDPVHVGHACVANFISQCNVVDEVWMMVNRKNPLKKNATVASDIQRFEMVSLISKKAANVKASDFELSRPTPSFTYETLIELKKKYPQEEFFLIIGSDSFLNFDKWKNSNKILKEFKIIVYPRPGYKLPLLQPQGFIFLNGAPEISLSSSLIREYIKSGWNINFFVPSEVAEYIKKNNLYV